MGGRTKHHFPGQFVTQQMHERAHRAAARVTAESDAASLDRSQIPAHGMQIDQRLGRMLVPSVACIDHRFARPDRDLRRGADIVMTDDDGVAKVGNHRTAILQGLARSGVGTRTRHVVEADGMAAQSRGGDLETKACPGARLEKQKRDRRASGMVCLGETELEIFGKFANLVDIIGRERFRAEDMFGLNALPWNSVTDSSIHHNKRHKVAPYTINLNNRKDDASRHWL